MPHEPEDVRRQPRFTDEPGDAELGYLAGILDGEGYFFAHANTYAFGITVQMNDRCVIEWLHEHFYGRHWRTRTGSGTTTFRWALCRYADLAFMLPRVIPHLVAKRLQGEALLDLITHLLDPPTRYFTPPTDRLSTGAAGAQERARRRKLRQAHRARVTKLSGRVRDLRHASS